MVRNLKICGGVWAALRVALFVFVPMESLHAAYGTTLTPHRAFYKMQLGDADQNSSVQAVTGRSAFTLDRDCNGWLSNEDYIIEFSGKEGNLNRIVSNFESWESDTGKMYSFEVKERSSFQSAKDFSGYANVSSSGSDAYFSMGEEKEMNLPDETYFPVGHLNAILESAEKGEKILAASVFTGAEPDDALLATNTVIGSWRVEASGVSMGGFEQDGYWPIQIAYFKPSAKAAEPEYEINYSMQPNGVVRRYIIDYGDFTINAELMKLEPVIAPNCQ